MTLVILTVACYGIAVASVAFVAYIIGAYIRVVRWANLRERVLS